MEGSPNVSIGGSPALRVGDPFADGSAVTGGAGHVFINGRPAARMGDLVSNGASIAQGAASVKIGDSGGAEFGWQIERNILNKIKEAVRFKATIFYPGAGFDGSYIDDLEIALREAGLANVYIDRAGENQAQSNGTLVDVSAVLTVNNFFEEIVNEPTAGIEKVVRFSSGGPQLNLIGYSYGGLVAAVNAMLYTRITGHEVDHLVLIAVPVLNRNLDIIRMNSKIKNVLICDLVEHGDVLTTGEESIADIIYDFAVISSDYLTNYGERHFYYAKEGEEGNLRRRQLAQYLYNYGLR